MDDYKINYEGNLEKNPLSMWGIDSMQKLLSYGELTLVGEKFLA